MAGNIISAALDALTSKKGAVIAGITMLGVATLVNIARTDGTQARAPTAVVPAQATGTVTGTSATAPTGQRIASALAPDQVRAVEGVIRDYMLKNPELLVEMSKALETRERDRVAVEQVKLINNNKAKLFSSEHDYVRGGAAGDVSVVEFFDYNCGWCKRAIGDVVQLTKSDPNVRFVLKEFPIFGEDSIAAAKAAMASHKQGKYWEYHVALMREKRVTKDNVLTIAKAVGLDVARLEKDMKDPELDRVLAETAAIAQGLKIDGTPAFIIDNKVNIGYLSADGLKAQIDEIRKNGCKMC